MKSAEFAEAYPQTLPETTIHWGNHPPEVQQAQDFSHNFGRLLHARLSGTEPDIMTSTGEITEYIQWTRDDFVPMWRKLPSLNAEDTRNELNFHMINQHMLPLWLPIHTTDEWPDSQVRSRVIGYGQTGVSIEGVCDFVWRDSLARRAGEHALYNETNKEFIGVLTGVVQEYDAAIILMDVMRKHPNLTVVPAPVQFLRHGKKANVNFIVTDTVQKRTVGIQVKSRVDQGDLRNADNDRVVFIDGDTDLGNRKALRTKKHKSDVQVKSWPGIISADYVANMRTHGKAPLSPEMRHRLTTEKFHAKHALGKLAVDRRPIVDMIAERIMEKL